MDSKEITTYLEIAEEQLSDAQLAYREHRYALSTFLSASSAENATSALILSLGAKPSKKHRNSLVLYRLASLAILCRGLRLCRISFSVSADASWPSVRNEYLYTHSMPGAVGAGWTEHAANAPNLDVYTKIHV